MEIANKDENNKLVPQTKVHKLQAEIEATEKEFAKNQASLNAKKLKLKKELLKQNAEDAVIRHLEFFKDKTPYWVGIKQSWTHRYLRVAIGEPHIEGENEFKRAKVNMIEIKCDGDMCDTGLHGTTSAEFVMKTLTDGINTLIDKESWMNVTEEVFMTMLNERTKPFFDMIKNATKDVFKGNLLGPAVTPM